MSRGIDAPPEDSLLVAAREYLPDQLDHGAVEVAEFPFAHVLTARDVLGAHEPYEVRMRLMMVECQFCKPADRSLGIALIDVELLLCGADRDVRALENGDVELLLAAEVVVDHSLRRARSSGDLVDSASVESMPGELTRCDVENVSLCHIAVATTFGDRSLARNGARPFESVR